MIKINGEYVEIDRVTLAEFLESSNYSIGKIAVEINGEIVPKSRYSETVLCDGDEIEVVSFVGGG